MTRADLKRRLAALDALPRIEELPATPEGMQRIGHGLFVPMPMPATEWERRARAEQAALNGRERNT